MPNIQLSFSDILSLVALVASLYSIIYTKKQFEAAFYPRLTLQVAERNLKDGLKTGLSFKLQNQSNERTATNVSLEAALSHPVWHWRLWTVRWYEFYQKDSFDIPPEQIKTLPLSHAGGAEVDNFLLESFPELVYPENDPNTPEEVAFKKPVDFLLHVHVEFQPPIVNAKKIRQNFYYRLSPQFRTNNGNPYCLNFWDIDLLKAS